MRENRCDIGFKTRETSTTKREDTANSIVTNNYLVFHLPGINRIQH